MLQRRDSEMGRGGGGGGRGGRGGGDGRGRDNGGPPQFDRMGGGRGGGDNNFGGGPGGGGGWDRRPGGMGQPPNHMNDKQEITFTVPAAKCGIIIGRGKQF